jgi:Tol biopolymer transport system component
VNTDPDVSPDGRAIVFASTRSGPQHIWRMDDNGANARQLTTGAGEARPRFMPDGQSIVYNSTTDFAIWRLPVAGGVPIRLTDGYARDPTPSPDGAFIAYTFRDKQAAQQWKIAVMPAGGGPPVRIFDRHRADFQTFELGWTRDGRALTYEAAEEGVSNLWSQPLAGGPPARLTDFTTDYIYGFAWSDDGKQLAVVRGAWDRDVVLFSLRP